MTVQCELCGQWFSVREVLDHLRRLHPAEYDTGPTLWPDGQPVIVDMTMTPDRFEGEDGHGHG